jgi:hypothetical protein
MLPSSTQRIASANPRATSNSSAPAINNDPAPDRQWSGSTLSAQISPNLASSPSLLGPRITQPPSSSPLHAMSVVGSLDSGRSNGYWSTRLATFIPSRVASETMPRYADCHARTCTVAAANRSLPVARRMVHDSVIKPLSRIVWRAHTTQLKNWRTRLPGHRGPRQTPTGASAIDLTDCRLNPVGFPELRLIVILRDDRVRSWRQRNIRVGLSRMDPSQTEKGAGRNWHIASRRLCLQG